METLKNKKHARAERSRFDVGAMDHPDRFAERHVGPGAGAVKEMLQVCGFDSLEALCDAAVPENIRLNRELRLPESATESAALDELRAIARQNQVFRSYLGLGYSDCITPPVIQRNVLENPGWYTQYTPYQAEIAQGRLEALLNFQTMVADLTGLEIANASLLDEGTAAAEAMTMTRHVKGKEGRNAFFVSDQCLPQTIDVVRTRARPLGIEIVVGDAAEVDFGENIFGVLLQYPTADGEIIDYSEVIKKAHEAGALVVMAADILALTLLKPPGELGADIAIGNTQRFGVPLGFGGPHAAYFATRNQFKRSIPGRIVGVSKDAAGRPAYRLALQTREQHIRREKATSNICTAQVLLAVIAAMYAVYHGPERLRKIARRTQQLTRLLASGLSELGYAICHSQFFDTLKIHTEPGKAGEIIRIAERNKINLRLIDESHVGISLDEAAGLTDVKKLLEIFDQESACKLSIKELDDKFSESIPSSLQRESEFLAHPVFHQHHSETEMLRYLKRLESRDLSLTHSMIPLGSCTMKLNASAEMFPVTWPEFGRLHPFAPEAQIQGYRKLFQQLEEWLAEITGFAAVSLQPNAGSVGEYAGLLTIRRRHEDKDQGHRNICLIPTSAHGTNPASAIMAGMKVVAVQCDERGNIDVQDLRAKATEHRDNLAALMVTYPSTHGVFEKAIKDICAIIHENGGLVYLDGANMNAQVGLCRPGEIGADVCHLNLHKTFCIPHGGGGPGVGPICVTRELAPFLPNHRLAKTGGEKSAGAVASAPWGSASILVISWMYIRMMGAAGLKRATQVAILNANYLAKRLGEFFPVLYKADNGIVAHECIIDLRQHHKVTVEDIAKRLMDYGFHAPTISWPVAGTMMVEPTESESKEELDRFREAMIQIYREIQAIESGEADPKNNLLKNAPHTASVIASDEWNRPYTRGQAAYPAPWLQEHKFWPAVSRIDNVYGDRNPVCTCAGMEEFGN